MPVTRAPLTFEAFFLEHHARLVRACLVLSGDPAEAEELAQEAMARALERWDRVSEMRDPEGYVYRTALNLHRKASRRLARAARCRILPTPTDQVDAEDRLDLLRSVRRLPRTQREVLALVE